MRFMGGSFETGTTALLRWASTQFPAADLAGVRSATAAELLLVVCLSAAPETVAARIDAREPDHWPGKAPLIERARRLAVSTPLLPGIDLVIETERRTAADVAEEIFQAMRERGVLEAALAR